MAEIVFIAFVWLGLYAFCAGPKDKLLIRPAKCFRAYACRWPECTCRQHQHQHEGV